MGKRILGVLMLMLLVSGVVFATHNRAGFITFKSIGGTNCLCDSFTIVTYTRTSSQADRPWLPISWGDGTSDSLRRTAKYDLGSNYPDISVNIYNIDGSYHCFPGPGTYTVSIEDPNRNADVRNIPSSVNVPFYIETTVTIDPFVGCDNSPVILNPPIDVGCIGEIYTYNPNAYDPDGDSLSYKLVPCRGANGAYISLYNYPLGTQYFTLNPVTGDLVWDTPRNTFADSIDAGEWNVAIVIEEWRKTSTGLYIKMGEVTLDMQITIRPCKNTPPVIQPLHDTCLVAGGTVHYLVRATDADGDGITLSASGGPFLVSNPATFPQVFGVGSVQGNFYWNTDCQNIRKAPYVVSFKAIDNDNHFPFEFPPTDLVDFMNVNITIVAPPPYNLTAQPRANSIDLKWNESPCPNALGYKIYRHVGPYNGTLSCCPPGVPKSTGFVYVGLVSGVSDTVFNDDNHGLGLNHGITYCYVVTAFFADSSESCASNQACAELKKDSPIITNVDIRTTNTDSGKIYIAWAKPNQLDTVNQYRGPFKYKIYRSDGFFGNNLVLIDSTASSALLSFTDTIYYDTLHNPLNTKDNPWSYRVEIYNHDTLINKSQIASSVFLTATPTDNQINLSWDYNDEWIDTLFAIYRQNLITPSQWDFIGTSTNTTYADDSIANAIERCYFVQTIGHYSDSGFVYPIINNSQRTCATPRDNIPPCSPNGLVATPGCLIYQDVVTWNNPNNSCANDVMGYFVYYSPEINGTYSLIATLHNATDTIFTYDNDNSIAGCFRITAFDSSGNESRTPVEICVDNCPVYVLPNVFTPNGDGINDLFHPFPYSYVKDIDIRIFDRWGILMFKTTDPHINWDGINASTKKECPDGVYFYICHVHEIHYDGIRTRVLKGNIELIKEK